MLINFQEAHADMLTLSRLGMRAVKGVALAPAVLFRQCYWNRIIVTSYCCPRFVAGDVLGIGGSYV